MKDKLMKVDVMVGTNKSIRVVDMTRENKLVEKEDMAIDGKKKHRINMMNNSKLIGQIGMMITNDISTNDIDMAKKDKLINGVDKFGELIDFGKPQVVSRPTWLRKEGN